MSMAANNLSVGMWAHPAAGSAAVEAIEVFLERRSPTNLYIRYEATGRTADLAIPAPAARLRANNLWQTTCFELFLRAEGQSGYLEFNFSPSGQWAAYEFRAYRDGMVQARIPADPIIESWVGPGRLVVDVLISLNLPEEAYVLNLAAVVEERGVGKSYWSHWHSGESPDFHHPSCFVLELPPPSAP
jgi:hypothetical protein